MYFRTWVSCELPVLGPEQSIFVLTRPKSETSLAFNVAAYILSSLFCMSCLVRTIIRRKTKGRDKGKSYKIKNFAESWYMNIAYHIIYFDDLLYKLKK